MLFMLDGVDYSDVVADTTGFAISYKKRTVGSSRTALSGLQYSPKVVYKAMISIVVDPLEESRATALTAALANKYISVSYDDLKTGASRSAVSMMPSETTATLKIEDVNGTNYWDGITFSLEER